MPENKEKYLVTSALTYANGYTHLGHIAGSILPADIFVRYKRLTGADIIYVCGSDEFGTAMEVKSIEENITIQEVIDKYHFSNKKAYEDLGMSFDIYSRTSKQVHIDTAQQFFLDLYKKGLFKERTEKQLYSEKEQRFLSDRFVLGECPNCGYEDARGDQCENCGKLLSPFDLINPRSKLTGDIPVVKESKHLYFPLSEYSDKLKNWLGTKKNWKTNVLNYCNGLLKSGLEDRSVTRDLKWGVQVPVEEFKDKVIYVWIEAPVGYISATKDLFETRGTPDKWKDYWYGKDTKMIHFLGKDNIIFHAIIFPAMLMAHGEFILADNVPANEFLNLNGEKFSKSKGVGSLVKDILKLYPADVIRYSIASSMPENRDTDFEMDEFRTKNNNELAAILGNFVNRTVVFAKSKFENKVPADSKSTKEDSDILAYATSQSEIIGKHYDEYHFKDALSETFNVIRACNKYFNDNEPWKKVKDESERCASIINTCLNLCYTIAILIEPVLPNTSKSIFGILNADGKDLKWSNVGKKLLTEGKSLGENQILFPFIEGDKDDSKSEEAPKAEIKKAKQEKDSKEKTVEKVTVTNDNLIIGIDDFKKVQLKVAKVIEAEKIEGSKKLLRIIIQIGDEVRQIVSGIAEYYTPESLIGRKVIVVYNLKPSKLMKVESEGMLLAAKSNGKLTLVTVDSEIDSGA